MNEKIKIQTPAQLVGYNQRKDRSMSIRFETREYQPEEIKQLAEIFQSEGWLLFSPNELKESDVPKEEAQTDTKKPSRRLRDVLFVWWKQKKDKGDTLPDFDGFYKAQMDNLIEQIKDNKLK